MNNKSRVEYRIDAKTIADHPSQNRRWHTFTTANSPQNAIAQVQKMHPGQNIVIENVWAKVPASWWK